MPIRVRFVCVCVCVVCGFVLFRKCWEKESGACVREHTCTPVFNRVLIESIKALMQRSDADLDLDAALVDFSVRVYV